MSELSDAAKEEIAAAVKILKEDGVHIHKTYAKFKADLDAANTPPTGEGGPPPVKQEDNQDPPPKKKRGLGLWGEHDE